VADGDVQASRPEPVALPLDPAAAIRPGRFDAAALLVLWVMRCAAPTVLIAGLIYARLVSERRFEAIPTVTTPSQALRVLLSPFAGVAVAVALRLLADVAALVLAYPLSKQVTGSAVGPDIRRPFVVWAERLHLIRAYRSLRWTSTVRTYAARRLGRWGRGFTVAGPVLLIADVVLVIALLVMIVVITWK
jgi:hypothetical protein